MGRGRGSYFLTHFKGFLDRLRENLEVLDEQISEARKMSKSGRRRKDPASLQWTKTLRDLVQLRNETLDKIKAHMLGRDETGVVMEPPDHYDGQPEISFERDFSKLLAPWSKADLKLECQDCKANSEAVSTRVFDHPHELDEYVDLCDKCYDKRLQESGEAPGEGRAAAHPASKADVNAILQSASLVIKTLKGLPPNQQAAKLQELLTNEIQVAPGMEAVYAAYKAKLQEELDRLKGTL